MPNPDFTQLELNTGHPPQSLAEWQTALERATGQPAAGFLWRTMEQIDVRPLYTAADTAGLPNLDHAAGLHAPLALTSVAPTSAAAMAASTTISGAPAVARASWASAAA